MRLLLRVQKLGSRAKKKHPDNVKHVSECLQRFLNDARNAWMGIEDVVAEDETCECKKFKSTPHQMFGRRKERMYPMCCPENNRIP
ncbi:hypothetical protein NPIL_397921 [Nephila pilipes]|uniref:Uncharacterized protein n=1 Tax=Nephila pilipes TaxID=299642 RepID=A0A8X6N6U7_NEPPI|nr:hypothetical protein NPIL_397921 [Nephila pilipes]